MCRAALWLLLASSVPACDRGVPPLASLNDSPTALARDVLSALAAGDQPRLRALALTEQEFRDHVWPHLPASRPERNLPFAYVWGDLRQKSEAGLVAVGAGFAGRALDVVTVRFGQASAYGTVRVHRDAVVVVRTPAGTTEDVRVCGAMIERGGRWKVFSYVVD